MCGVCAWLLQGGPGLRSVRRLSCTHDELRGRCRARRVRVRCWALAGGRCLRAVRGEHVQGLCRQQLVRVLSHEHPHCGRRGNTEHRVCLRRWMDSFCGSCNSCKLRALRRGLFQRALHRRRVPALCRKQCDAFSVGSLSVGSLSVGWLPLQCRVRARRRGWMLRLPRWNLQNRERGERVPAVSCAYVIPARVDASGELLVRGGLRESRGAGTIPFLGASVCAVCCEFVLCWPGREGGVPGAQHVGGGSEREHRVHLP